MDAQGRRCTARDHLQYHHRQPYGYGGDHSVANLLLTCAMHNRYLAEIDFGKSSWPARTRTVRLQPEPVRAG